MQFFQARFFGFDRKPWDAYLTILKRQLDFAMCIKLNVVNNLYFDERELRTFSRMCNRRWQRGRVKKRREKRRARTARRTIFVSGVGRVYIYRIYRIKEYITYPSITHRKGKTTVVNKRPKNDQASSVCGLFSSFLVSVDAPFTDVSRK